MTSAIELLVLAVGQWEASDLSMFRGSLRSVSQEMEVEMGKPGVLGIQIKIQEQYCSIKWKEGLETWWSVLSIIGHSNGLAPRCLIGSRSMHWKYNSGSPSNLPLILGQGFYFTGEGLPWILF